MLRTIGFIKGGAISVITAMTIVLCSFSSMASAAGSPHLICAARGLGVCATPSGAHTTTGTSIITLSHSFNHIVLRWRLSAAGKVGAHTFVHKDWDTKYHGVTIYKIELNANQKACMGTHLVNKVNRVQLVSCKTGKGTLWVKKGYWYINIRATNNSTNGAFRKLMTTYKGKVITSRVGAHNSLNQEWNFD